MILLLCLALLLIIVVEVEATFLESAIPFEILYMKPTGVTWEFDSLNKKIQYDQEIVQSKSNAHSISRNGFACFVASVSHSNTDYTILLKIFR